MKYTVKETCVPNLMSRFREEVYESKAHRAWAKGTNAHISGTGLRNEENRERERRKSVHAFFQAKRAYPQAKTQLRMDF